MTFKDSLKDDVVESLVNLECFVRSAETFSFSEAARRLSLTPAAVSRNVAMLERNLGVRLFLRSTRRLTITEAGERLLAGIAGNLEGLQAALAELKTSDGKPAGTLRVTMPVTFGLRHILPLLPEFRKNYPAVQIDWQFDNRPINIIENRFDVGIGGGFELAGGLIARRLVPIHLVAVASPAYLASRVRPWRPNDLTHFDGIVQRSVTTGRINEWLMRDAGGQTEAATLAPTIVFNDPLPVAQAALSDLGVALLALPDAIPHLADGSLERLLPDWFADLGDISLYHANPKSLPSKTRVFIDHVVGHFRSEKLAERFDARVG